MLADVRSRNVKLSVGRKSKRAEPPRGTTLWLSFKMRGKALQAVSLEIWLLLVLVTVCRLFLWAWNPAGRQGSPRDRLKPGKAARKLQKSKTPPHVKLETQIRVKGLSGPTMPSLQLYIGAKNTCAPAFRGKAPSHWHWRWLLGRWWRGAQAACAGGGGVGDLSPQDMGATESFARFCFLR